MLASTEHQVHLHASSSTKSNLQLTTNIIYQNSTNTMKVPTTTICLAGLTGLGLASPLSLRQETRARFSVIAARSASPVHMQSVVANGQGFWIGKETATYCPPEVDPCPSGDVTVLDYFDGSLSLVCRYSIRLLFLFLSRIPPELLIFSAQDVSVPGGQRVYVAPTGELGFTRAHSASIPPGSTQDGFTLSSTLATTQLASLGFSKLGATGFLACPAGPNGTAPFKVFANVSALKDADVPGGSLNACIGFDALAGEYTESVSAAWQYT